MKETLLDHKEAQTLKHWMYLRTVVVACLLRQWYSITSSFQACLDKNEDSVCGTEVHRNCLVVDKSMLFYHKFFSGIL